MGATTLEALAEKLDGLCEQVARVEVSVNKLETKSQLFDQSLATLVNPPNVETRLQQYVDAKDEHRKGNIAQAFVNLQTIVTQGQEIIKLTLEGQIREVRHIAETTERQREADHKDQEKHQEKTDNSVEDLKKYLWMGLGGLAVLTTLLKFIHIG